MKPIKNGWKKESLRFKDFSHEKAFGSTVPTEIKPLGRNISDLPVVFQGNKPSCVDCSVTWALQRMKKSHPKLSWEWLSDIAGTDESGSTPSQVLEPARKIGVCTEEAWLSQMSHVEKELNAAGYRLPSYFVIERPTAQNIYAALKISDSTSVMIGVNDWQGAGPHMMCGYDVTDDGKSLKCANWWDENTQSEAIVPFEQIVYASVLDNTIAVLDPSSIRVSWKTVLNSKIMNIFTKTNLSKIVTVSAALLLAIGALFSQKIPNTKFGAAGIYDQYSPVVAGAGISSTDQFLPVSTLTLYTGEIIHSTDTNLFPAYFIVNPQGATREKIECDGLDPLTLKFTPCYRGLSAKCPNATSTVIGASFPHSAGERVIMSNDSCFYNRFIDSSTDQTATGTKTLTSNLLNFGNGAIGPNKIVFQQGQGSANPFIYASNATSVGWSPDGVNTFLFNSSGTVVSASSTRGIFLTDSQIGVKASSTAGLAFDASGNLDVSASSTSSTNGGFLSFNNLGQLYWQVTKFVGESWTWAGNQIFGGNVTINGTEIVNGAATFNSNVTITTQSTTSNAIVNFQTLTAFTATTTAGSTITVGQPIFVGATSTAFPTDTSVTTSTFNFVGIAAESATVGQAFSYTRPGGVDCHQGGLSAGYQQFLNGVGSVTSTPGTFIAKIGQALSATCLQVSYPKFTNSGSFSVAATGFTTTTVGFYPSTISLAAQCDANPTQSGASLSITNVGGLNNNGSGDPGFFEGYVNSETVHALVVATGNASMAGSVENKTPWGFSYHETTHGCPGGGTGTVHWSADSL